MKDLFVITAPGLEQITARELTALGINNLQIEKGGISFQGGLRELYTANIHLRTASRVLVRAGLFHASTFHELERKARKIVWSEYLQQDAAASFRVTCKKSKLYHSDAVAERLAKFSGAKQVDAADEDEESLSQLFVVRLDHDELSLSADSSGDLLHRRGYRQAIAKAPLRETIAAAMILSSDWDPATPLVDPMCGSGTIAIEAALIARNIPPGVNRKFAFQNWPDYDAKLFEEVKNLNPTSNIKPLIYASDRDPGAIHAAQSNAERAGVADAISMEVLSLTESLSLERVEGFYRLRNERELDKTLQPSQGPRDGWIVVNPPYGLRIGEAKPLRNLYATLGKMVPKTWRLGLLSANKTLEGQLGGPPLRLEVAFKTANGGIPVRYVVTTTEPRIG